MAGPKFDLSDSPGHLLRRAQQYAFDLFSKEIGDSRLTPRQFAVLLTVQQNEGLSQTDLVKRTGIDRSTLADIVRRLVDRGLVMRKRTRHDARMYALRLSDKGIATMREAAPAVNQTDERLLAALPQRDRDAFVKGLERMVEELSDTRETPKAD